MYIDVCVLFIVCVLVFVYLRVCVYVCVFAFSNGFGGRVVDMEN